MKNITKITLTQFEERLYEKVSFGCGDHHKKIILTQTEERLKIRKIPVSSGKHHKKIKLTQIDGKLTEKILFSCGKHHKKIKLTQIEEKRLRKSRTVMETSQKIKLTQTDCK